MSDINTVKFVNKSMLNILAVLYFDVLEKCGHHKGYYYNANQGLKL